MYVARLVAHGSDPLRATRVPTTSGSTPPPSRPRRRAPAPFSAPWASPSNRRTSTSRLALPRRVSATRETRRPPSVCDERAPKTRSATWRVAARGPVRCCRPPAPKRWQTPTRACVPFPFAATRAKGRRFDAEGETPACGALGGASSRRVRDRAIEARAFGAPVTLRLLANIGAEEPLAEIEAAGRRELMADLFRLTLSRRTWRSSAESGSPLPWPAEFRRDGGAGLSPGSNADRRTLSAWLNTAGRGTLEGRSTRGVPAARRPRPDVVRAGPRQGLHRGASARDRGLRAPRASRSRRRCSSPDDLRVAGRASPNRHATPSVREHGRNGSRGRFTLKPRMGGSGRGRLGSAPRGRPP